MKRRTSLKTAGTAALAGPELLSAHASPGETDSTERSQPQPNILLIMPDQMRGDAQVRPWLHGEHAPAYDADQAYHFLTDRCMKYLWRPAGGEEQLFDLAEDPQELRDLARESGGGDRLGVWRERLVGVLAGRPEGFTDGRSLIPGRPYGNLVPGSRAAATATTPS